MRPEAPPHSSAERTSRSRIRELLDAAHVGRGMPRTNTFAVAFVASFAVANIIEGLLEQSEAARGAAILLHAVALSAILFAWAWTDSSRRGTRLSAAQGICLVTFNVLAVPFYLWRARPPAVRWRWLIKGLMVAVLTAISVGLVLAVFSL